jgi:uncharacterized membrane protein YccC
LGLPSITQSELRASLDTKILFTCFGSFLHLEQAHHCLTAAAHVLQPDSKGPFTVEAAKADS